MISRKRCRPFAPRCGRAASPRCWLPAARKCWRARAGGLALIIADLEMPGMNGRELFEHLNDDPQTRDIPVFLIHTEWVLPGQGKERPLNTWSQPTPSGRTADAHLTKPVDGRQLAAFVRRLLGH